MKFLQKMLQLTFINLIQMDARGPHSKTELRFYPDILFTVPNFQNIKQQEILDK